MKAANIGETLYIESKVLKNGKKLSFTECKIFNEKLDLLYSGFHSKAFLPKTWVQEFENLNI